MAKRTDLERFLDFVERTVDGCWVWHGSRNYNGYGHFVVKEGRGWFQVMAHRWSYEQFVGPIPDGLVLDHFVCNRKFCTNPEHVRPVTWRENTLRSNSMAARNAAKTHCPQGHPYNEVNTYVRPRDSARICRSCAPLHRARRRSGMTVKRRQRP